MHKIVAAALFLMFGSTAATAFEVSFDFSNVRPCAGGTLRITPSPQFTLSDVPAGTAELDFHLIDITADFVHGGRAVPYPGGDVIPADTFKYVGPCPPNGAVHTYEWTVTALDAAGTELGKTAAQGQFPMS